MFTSDACPWNIIHSPRCGVLNFAQWARASKVEGLPAWALPSEARKVIGEERWRAKPILITVRDPVSRFISAVEHWAREMKIEPNFEGNIAKLEQEGLDSAPRLLWPQKRWLSCKIDVILPMSKFAEFANETQNGRSLSARIPYPRTNTQLPAALAGRVRRLYAEDYALFDHLPVWPSDSTKVYRMFGLCHRCTRKRQEADEARAAALSAYQGNNTPPIGQTLQAGAE